MADDTVVHLTDAVLLTVMAACAAVLELDRVADPAIRIDLFPAQPFPMGGEPRSRVVQRGYLLKSLYVTSGTVLHIHHCPLRMAGSAGFHHREHFISNDDGGIRDRMALHTSYPLLLMFFVVESDVGSKYDVLPHVCVIIRQIMTEFTVLFFGSLIHGLFMAE